MKTNLLKAGACLLAALLLSPVTSSAQNRVTYGEVVQSLGASAQTAQKIGINVDQFRADIEERIRAEGGENASSPPPVSEVLSKLPNFIVQIQFNLDSDVIRPESWEVSGKIADALHHPLLRGNRFLIVGHTDARGDRMYNLELSERRAAAVKEMLVNVFKVPADHLLAVGLGEEQLFDTSDPNADVNRRVEILNIGPA
jgi:OmpA-OmpF porin, OOP family